MHLPPKFRPWLMRIHTWSGVALGLYAIAVGVSGSILVFRDELAAMADPQLHTASGFSGTINPDIVLHTVRLAVPDGRPISVTWPNRETPFWMSYVLLKSGAREVYVDPASGRVQGIRDPRSGWLGWLDRLHTNLLVGRLGRQINTYAALILIVLAITGVFLWWPSKSVRLDLRAGWRKLSWQLHHLSGIVSALFIVVLAFTGTYYYWSSAYVRTVGRFFSRTSEPKMAQSGHLMSLVQLESQARASFPRLPIHRMQVVERPDQAVRVAFRVGTPGEFHRVSTVFLNPVTGVVLNRIPLSERPIGDAILSWFSALHFGVFGGLPIKILWAVLGLSLPTLAITGILMWWRRVILPTRRSSLRDREKRTSERTHAPVTAP
jgi:uncharacterized iron-regulated membrane protein